MEACQVITFSNRAMKFSLLLQMKYRTRFPTCTYMDSIPAAAWAPPSAWNIPKRYISIMQNVTLLLQEWLPPPSTGSRNTGHGEGGKIEIFLHRKRKISPQPVKRPHIFKIKMNVVFSTQIYIRKISSSKQLSSGNIVSLESLRYYSSM